jgi:hypothetical protein
MAEQQDKDTRKSFFDSLPSYLAGLAAVATATVAVLTYLHNRNVAGTKEQETTPITEPEVSRDHVGAVPSVEIAPTRPTPAGTAPASSKPAAGTPAKSATQAAPTLQSALHPVRCASYVGTWRLSSGELLSLFDNERAEARAGATAAPRFGRWACSGRNEEMLYLTMDREPTLAFTASGDGKLYQRITDQRTTTTPLTATRAPEK